MGVVYEAEQVSLDRRVALKVLPMAAAMDAKQFQRFQLEAQAAACLHHTNIVPVHAVGCERGVQFYAMQFIEGRSLAQLIAELRRLDGPGPGRRTRPRTWPTSRPRLWRPSLSPDRFAQAARPDVPAEPGHDMPVPRSPTVFPIRHSPDRPVTRRPIRRACSPPAPRPAAATTSARWRGSACRPPRRWTTPTPAASSTATSSRPTSCSTSQGQFWVTDFGLAQVQGKPGLTLTGDVLGTLRYMSPEQALGRRVVIDGRTDIYSLGVTLYELLTLRPAVDGRDRQEILRQIAEEEPAPPRRLNPAVPRDLETILLKAMAKEPSGRYATAKELADDLRRFLEHKPIKARRPSLLDRMAKLSRRHQPEVWSAAVCLLLLGAVLLGSVGWIVRDHSARLTATEREVNLAMAEAMSLRDSKLWPEALDAAKRAKGILGRGGSKALRERVNELRSDLQMVVRLDEIRLPGSGPKGSLASQAESRPWQDSAYCAAFREYGIDVDALEREEAADRIRARTICSELTTALDWWADQRRKVQKPSDTSWKHLIAVAQAADSDRWRKRLREAWQRRDVEALAHLAASANLDSLPVQTLSLLGGFLDEWGAGEQCLLVLRRAQQAYPDDFHINFQLGWSLDHGKPRGSPDEVIRFYTAAVALRPRNATTHLLLGKALLEQGEHDGAVAEWRRAAKLEPNADVSHLLLGLQLAHVGACLHEAIAELRMVNELGVGPDHVTDLNNAAWMLSASPEPKLRDAGVSLRLAKRAVELVPNKDALWNTLGVAQYRAGQWRSAIESLSRAMHLANGQFESMNTFFLAMAHWRTGGESSGAPMVRPGRTVDGAAFTEQRRTSPHSLRGCGPFGLARDSVTHQERGATALKMLSANGRAEL